ncbi:hypothetical protein ACFCP7_28235, partial [Paenibacillus elgii]
MRTKDILIFLCFMLMLTYSSPIMAASGETKYHYGNKGVLTEASNSNGTIYYYYDENGNLMRKYTTGNLLINSSFETYTGTNGVADGWTPWQAGETIPNNQVTNSSVSSGLHAQQVSGTNIVNGMNVWQDVAVAGDATYTLNGRVNIRSLTNARAQVVIFYFDAANNLISGENPLDSSSLTDWMTFGRNIITPANTTK